ncbi:hypothetical protein FSP39_006692 [Pinctada imbricata]|uniref:Uncharacterized protein n=1 Tax=Pinctada imbricata TaxID=66713 RepID=A0AA89C262_PINIB|nr:hypothetical protein FSP39_006692 [Pinctada imbricata]
MVRISNIVCSVDLDCRIDLRNLAKTVTNIRYHSDRHNVAIWQNRRIGGNCLVYAKGKLVCNGYVESTEAAKRRLRCNARKLQKLGYPVRFKKFRIFTISMVHDLGIPISLPDLRNARYEPEIIPGAVLAIEDVRFTCFHSGKIIISGIKRDEDIDLLVFPTICEIFQIMNKRC